jgi:hypothetical protein
MKHLKHGKRGVSNVIVVMLSLVLVVIIASNVILWGYQMNQSDWERMQEAVDIVNVSPINASSWSVAQSEYVVNVGSHVSGSYVDTQAIDDRYETFMKNYSRIGIQAGQDSQLDIVGAFAINLGTYSLRHIRTIEVQLIYRANVSSERWYLKAYDWATADYSDTGFNTTAGDIPSTNWDIYAVNFTDQWQSYLNNNGTIFVKFQDNLINVNQTSIDIDFLAVRAVIDGAEFVLQNKGSVTTHLVSLWVNTLTEHRRYDVNLFINSGDAACYIRDDITLPQGPFIVKIVTERGTTSIFKTI